MASIRRFTATRAHMLVVGLALTPVIAANGCADAQEQLCCTEFKAGATITADIGGSAKAQVAAQAVADVTGIAQAAIEDLTTACRGIATDLGASEAEQDAANAQNNKNDQMKSWCAAAARAIASAKATAGVSLALDVKPPKCEASFGAKANCQAKCSGSAKCDVHAEPPSCSGGPGSLSISCKGECNAEAAATVRCEGSCTAPRYLLWHLHRARRGAVSRVLRRLQRRVHRDMQSRRQRVGHVQRQVQHPGLCAAPLRGRRAQGRM
jgi:hypothetical protein